ncbi:lipopolysaccharide assembly protein LapA domain-containing protein [Rhodococcus sp. DMF-1]|uniref:LapA family protein n=1 Tax=Rhodococcus TaxID=1827 RepID=UPI0006612D4B|nr:MULTISPECIES: lipopolysaccharide assembly protein LapA domain-containing protein [Rhodococcus]UIR38008.1 lipopolysaccharide assembly protein LapA domain-containing protein [Rhodococcus sp. DMF-1]
MTDRPANLPDPVPDLPGGDRPDRQGSAKATPDSDLRPAPEIPLDRSRAASTWTGLVIGVLVLILLLVFILQNLDSVTMELFAWEFTLPLGVSLLLSAIAGALVMALAGGVRILQIKRAAKRR